MSLGRGLLGLSARAVQALRPGLWWVAVAARSWSADTPTPTPPLVFVQNSPGRFEVAAADAAVAHRVAAATEELWGALEAPLRLPAAFSSPIFVRVAAAGGQSDGAESGRAERGAFRVTVERGGIVSVQVRDDAAVASPALRHALVQGLTMRLAVAQHGVEAQLASPLWLEHGCVGWWRTRADAAQLDALKYASGGRTPPPLATLLRWQHGEAETPEMVAAATWLLSFLQTESGREREWPAFLTRLLRGDDPLAALASSYAGRFGTTVERELWWQTGYHHARRARTLPVFEAAESRAQLGALARFVFAAETEAEGEGATDAVMPLRDAIGRAREPVVAAELARRSAELARLVPALHPFYRNAGLALAEIFDAHGPKRRPPPPARRKALCAAFERDWRDAMELEAASAATLDRLEREAKRR